MNTNKLIFTFILSIGVLYSSLANAENWKQFGEIPDSPKFGKIDYYIDLDSIKIEGDIRSVWLKSVFSKPQLYKEGKTYTEFLSFSYFNCSNKTQAVTQIDIYNSEGTLVGSEKEKINYQPVAADSLDESIYKYICKDKKDKK